MRVASNDSARRAEGLRRAVAGGWLGDEATDADLVIFKDEERAVIGLLRRLPVQQRSALALVMDGYTPTEAAEILGMPPPTSRSHLRHARNRLRMELPRQGVDWHRGEELA